MQKIKLLIALFCSLFCDINAGEILSNEEIIAYLNSDSDAIAMLPGRNFAGENVADRIENERIVKTKTYQNLDLTEPLGSLLDAKVQKKDYLDIIIAGMAAAKTARKIDFARWCFSKLGKDSELNLVLLYAVYCMNNYSTNKYKMTKEERDTYHAIYQNIRKIGHPDVAPSKKFPELFNLLENP